MYTLEQKKSCSDLSSIPKRIYMNNKYFTVETLIWLTNIYDYITSLIKCTYFSRKERLLRLEQSK